MTAWRGGATRHARLQRLLAVAAIGAAVALPVVLVSVGRGVVDHEIATLEDAGYQIVVSAPGVHGINGTHALVDRLLRISGVGYASPVLSETIDAFDARGNVSPVLAEGVLPGPFSATLGPTESGLFPHPLGLGDPNDSIHYAHGTYTGPATYDVLVSQPYANSYNVSVGSVVRLDRTDTIASAVAYNVTGIFGPPVSLLVPAAAFAVVLPLSDLQLLTGYAAGPGTIVGDASDSIEVAVTPSIAGNSGAIAGVVSAIQALVPAWSVSTLSQQVAQLGAADAVLTGFYLALSSVGVVVGLLFLALVLVRRVDADRRSIGIRRAIGVPGRAIAVRIVGEGATIAGLGAGAGVVGGYVLVTVLARFGDPLVREAASFAVFPPMLLGELVVGIVGASVAASAAAVRVAFRTPVAEALR